jgi:hypothetical protein
MGTIGGSFFSPFPAQGELGLSLTSIQGGTGAAANAAAINASATSDSGSPFSILSTSHATVSSSPTINALQSGELSTQDHKIIAQIGGTANNSLQIPWNANGTEPSEITNLKSLGWIKQQQVQTTAGGTKPSSATYTLTPVGQAIYKRTVATTLGPGTQDTIGNATPGSSVNSAAVDSNLQSEVSTLVGALSSVGVNVQV